MIPRSIRTSVLTVLTVLTAGLASFLSAPAVADDVPDTTPPQVNLNPCWEGTSCRRVYAQVYGNLQPDDDLAVLGARIGDRVLAEDTFDDGTGFVPYGSFVAYGNDVAIPVDYALSVEVPRGTSDITFYARDLEGNTAELTTTVLGPVPPGPVRRLRAELVGARAAEVSWSVPDLEGDVFARYVVTTPGRHPRRSYSAPPYNRPFPVRYGRLAAGWHRFTVHAITTGGAGPSRTVHLLVPRRHRR